MGAPGELPPRRVMPTNDEDAQSILHRYTEEIGEVNRLILELDRYFLEEKFQRSLVCRDLALLRTQLTRLAKTVEKADRFNYRTPPSYMNPNSPLTAAWLISVAVGQSFRSMSHEIEALSGRADDLGRRLMAPNQYLQVADDRARSEVYAFSSDARNAVSSRDAEVVAALNGGSSSPLASISVLTGQVSRGWPSLDPRWPLAVCYLASLEISVNRADNVITKPPGQAQDPDDKELRARLHRVVNLMQGQGFRVTPFDEGILDKCIAYRNRVLHGGFTPDRDELGYILRTVPPFITNLHRALLKARLL